MPYRRSCRRPVMIAAFARGLIRRYRLTVEFHPEVPHVVE